MALWDSADLLARCKMHARRPTTDRAMPDTAWYSFLTEVQPEVSSDIYSRYPDFAYSAPILMTTPDGGRTYVFGVDAATDAIRPIGSVEIYAQLSDIPEAPLIPGDDFLIEGSLIRIPHNRVRAFTSGPYARFVARSDTAISASAAPTLQPKQARMLLVWKALAAWASRPGSGASPGYYEKKYEAALLGVLTEIAAAYNMQGANGNLVNARWWTTGDLLRTGQFNG